jgi:hypothetical protein
MLNTFHFRSRHLNCRELTHGEIPDTNRHHVRAAIGTRKNRREEIAA